MGIRAQTAGGVRARSPGRRHYARVEARLDADGRFGTAGRAILSEETGGWAHPKPRAQTRACAFLVVVGGRRKPFAKAEDFCLPTKAARS